MKPNKNHVMCPECFKPKMVFETQKQALNFIKFNGKDIQREGEHLRVYYCPACCGYHITSKPFKPQYAHQTDKLIEAYHISKKAKDMFRRVKTCLLMFKRLL